MAATKAAKGWKAFPSLPNLGVRREAKAQAPANRRRPRGGGRPGLAGPAPTPARGTRGDPPAPASAFPAARGLAIRGARLARDGVKP